MAFIKITAKEGQSIYDVNLMYYSGLDHLVKFCKDNNIDNINDQDVSGRELIFDTNLNSDLSSTSIVNKKGFVFTTGVFYEAVRVTEEGNFRVTSQGYTRVLH